MRDRTKIGPGKNLSAIGASIVIASALIWFAAVSGADSADFTDVGLVSALPFLAWVSVVSMVVGLAISLFAPATSRAILAVETALLILVIYGTPVLIEDGPRLNAAWRHMGIVEHIRAFGTVDSTIDAYFNWPGFFVLGAFLFDVAGIDSIVGIVEWSPVLINLACMGPLLILMRTVTHDVRLIWMAIWIYYMTNWVGQDYFSPQSFAYLLWLTLTAVLLRWFRPGRGGKASGFLPSGIDRLWGRVPEKARIWIQGTSTTSVSLTVGQRSGLLAVCMAIFLVINGSHQLTPFATLGGVLSLVVFNQIAPRWLPALMGTLIVIWLVLFATSFWSGHGASILSDLGNFDKAFSQSTVERVRGSDGHLLIVRFRLIFTGVVMVGALAGVLLRVRKGQRDVAFWLLLVTPFFLIAGQSYGGEMLLRVYFFALPFAAFFLASFLMTAASARNVRLAVPTVALVSCMLVSGMLLARYGNERMEHFTVAEAVAADAMYEDADPGSTIFTANWNAPIRHREYATYRYLALNDVHPLNMWIDPVTKRANVDAITLTMTVESDGTDAYLFLTRSQDAANELLGISPLSQDELIEELKASGRFRIVYANEDAILLLLLPQGA